MELVNHGGMTVFETILSDIHCMDDEIEQIIGRKVFGHIAAPTPTSLRITFGDGHVCLTLAEAQEYMRSLLIQAQRDPAGLPWPLNEPLPVLPASAAAPRACGQQPASKSTPGARRSVVER